MRQAIVLRLNPVKTVMLLLLLPLSSLIACTGDGTGPSENAQSQSPVIKLIMPEAGQTLSADTVEVQVEITDFIVDPEALGKAKVLGRGHWHLYLDGELLAAHVTDKVILDQLPPGPHHLRVSLANNDHSPLSPPVEDSVVVDVKEGVALSIERDLEH